MSDITKVENHYDETQIQVLEGLEAVRKRSVRPLHAACIIWFMKLWITPLTKPWRDTATISLYQLMKIIQ